MALLEVSGLSVRFGDKAVVDDISFNLDAGERLGIIGESGSGKSMTCLAILGLLPPTAQVSGLVRLNGLELTAPGVDLSKVRGAEVGVVFQEPQTALNPVLRVGRQLTTALRRHHGLDRAQAARKAIELAALVGLPDPARVVRRYPHELSGGQRQRVVIAMAMSCEPSLLLADEPTTALDATVQARVLDLMVDLTSRSGTAMVLITHDMAVAARTAQRLLVMRGGRIVEQGTVADLLGAPTQPYTAELVAAARATSLDLGEVGR